MLKNKVMEKVLKLTQWREKCLVVAAVRFFKICIGRKVSFVIWICISQYVVFL
jgi:protein phosphatase-4 regulatory subunit 3